MVVVVVGVQGKNRNKLRACQYGSRSCVETVETGIIRFHQSNESTQYLTWSAGMSGVNVGEGSRHSVGGKAGVVSLWSSVGIVAASALVEICGVMVAIMLSGDIKHHSYWSRRSEC